jgi:hypothetical protein
MARLSTIPAALARGAAALLACFAAGSIAAQTQVVAFYPLMTDLLDATATHGPVSLLGYNGAPAPLPPNNGVFHNGVYYYSTGGQDIRTPIMSSLNTTDFQVNVEFQLAGLPPSLFAPVLMGGHSYRWLGIYVQANGTVGIKHNNSNLLWSTTTLTTGVWYSAGLRYELGNVELFINGTSVLQAAIGPLTDGNNKNFTTNDLSNGRAHHGWIRNLLVVNDPTPVATAAAYGSGCQGSAGVPSLAPYNSPQLGITFSQNVANMEPNSMFGIMAIGFSNTMSPFGPLPVNLQTFGLGATCDLWVSADVSMLFPVASGAGTFDFPVPMDLGFAGLSFYFQGVSLDGGAPGGMAVTNAVASTIGF